MISHSENGNFCRVSVTAGLTLSTNRSDTSNTGRIVSSRNIVCSTRRLRKQWPERPRVVDSIVTVGSFFFSFRLTSPSARHAASYNGNVEKEKRKKERAVLTPQALSYVYRGVSQTVTQHIAQISILERLELLLAASLPVNGNARSIDAWCASR